MKITTLIWLGEAVLACVAAWLALFMLTYAYAGVGVLSWNPGQHQLHPVVFGLSVLSGFMLAYLSYVSLRAAKRGGEWKWR